MAAYVIDQPATFAAPPTVLGSAPRMKYGTNQQDIDPNGQPKWTVRVSAVYRPLPGQLPVAEQMDVTVMGENPEKSCQPGTQVQFTNLRVGYSSAEIKGDRIRGGKPYFGADSVAPVQAKAAAA